MKKLRSLSTLSGLYCGALIVSNILSFKTWSLFGFTLPAAVILFPLVYILNDIMGELYDYDEVKKVIFTGFATNLIAVIAYNIAILLPSSDFFTGQEAFALVLSNSLRILIASFTAYLVGSIVNLKIMSKLKLKEGNKGLMKRCVVSTLFGEGADTLIFITIAFIGTLPNIALLQMIIGQLTFKVVYEFICYPLTKLIINKLRYV